MDSPQTCYTSVRDLKVCSAVEFNSKVHKPYLANITGRICNISYQKRKGKLLKSPHNLSSQNNGIVNKISGVKRKFQDESNTTAKVKSQSVDAALGKYELICLCRLQDIDYPDELTISINASHYEFCSNLKLYSIVNIKSVECTVRRSTYKVKLTYGPLSSIHDPETDKNTEIKCKNLVVENTPRVYLHSLLTKFEIDKTVIDHRCYRFNARVVHIYYITIHRNCSDCWKPMMLDRTSGTWIHQNFETLMMSDAVCQFKHFRMHSSDKKLSDRTYLRTTVRCLVDDGTAQAEIFAEDDVAFELLGWQKHKKWKCDQLVRTHVQKIKYFPGNHYKQSDGNGKSIADFPTADKDVTSNLNTQLAISTVESFAEETLHMGRNLSIIAARFTPRKSNSIFSANERYSTASVITFCDDIMLTTQSRERVKFEVVRADEIHVRSEIKHLLSNFDI